MSFAVEVAVMLGQIVLGFYGFWLVWRVMLPWLPGPDDADDRIAVYAYYFTNPILEPVARVTRMPVRGVAVVALVGLAAGLVALPG